MELKKENVKDNEATFLDLHLSLKEKERSTSLYDKRDTYNFSIVTFPYKSSTLPSKMSFHLPPYGSL